MWVEDMEQNVYSKTKISPMLLDDAVEGWIKDCKASVKYVI